MHPFFPVSLRHARFTLVWTGFLIAAASAPAQGLLTPPGPPAPTMKSLQQISDQIGAIAAETRTSLNSPDAVVTISQPGSYYLTGNVQSLVIGASNVTIDLNGFAVSPPNGIDAVVIGAPAGTVSNVSLRNGRVLGSGVITPGASSWLVTFSGNSSHGVFVQGATQGILLENLTVSGFFNSINANSTAMPDTGAGLVMRNVTVRDCWRGVTTTSAMFENVRVFNCEAFGIFADNSTLRDVRVQRCETGISGSFLTLSEVVVRDAAFDGVNLFESTATGLNVSRARSGVNGQRNTLSRVVVSENRSHGISGGNHTVHNSIARANGGVGFLGVGSNYQNVTAIGNTSHGINGTGLTIDGALVTNNGGHGILAPESVVRGANARDNTGAGVYADSSSISACLARGNGDDGIRGLSSVISDSRAFGNDTTAGGYAAQGIVWGNGGRITNSLADTATPAIP